MDLDGAAVVLYITTFFLFPLIKKEEIPVNDIKQVWHLFTRPPFSPTKYSLKPLMADFARNQNYSV